MWLQCNDMSPSKQEEGREGRQRDSECGKNLKSPYQLCFTRGPRAPAWLPGTKELVTSVLGGSVFCKWTSWTWKQIFPRASLKVMRNNLILVVNRGEAQSTEPVQGSRAPNLQDCEIIHFVVSVVKFAVICYGSNKNEWPNQYLASLPPWWKVREGLGQGRPTVEKRAVVISFL